MMIEEPNFLLEHFEPDNRGSLGFPELEGSELGTPPFEVDGKVKKFVMVADEVPQDQALKVQAQDTRAHRSREHERGGAQVANMGKGMLKHT